MKVNIIKTSIETNRSSIISEGIEDFEADKFLNQKALKLFKNSISAEEKKQELEDELENEKNTEADKDEIENIEENILLIEFRNDEDVVNEDSPYNVIYKYGDKILKTKDVIYKIEEV